MSVLQSIHNIQKQFPVFVANRLAEVEKYSNKSDWKHVPSKQNPADEVSRGIPAKQFAKLPRWLTGPDFLLHADTEWPKKVCDQLTLPEDSPIFEKKVGVVGAVLPLGQNVNVETPTNRFMKYFSSWHRLKRATVWWIKFAGYIRAVK